MAQIPFIGPSYVYEDLEFDAQRSVNLMLMKSESETSKDVGAMVGTPGLVEFCDTGYNRIRGGLKTKGRVFVCAANKVIEIYEDGTQSVRGTINSTNGFVSMASNGSEVCLVDGAEGWILTLSDNSFNQITGGGWSGADTVTFIDGYFIFNDPQTGKYYISALYSGATIDALEFATAEGGPDDLVGVASLRRDLWLFGENTIEVAQNTGDADFPFQRVQGAFIEYGCVSKGTIAKAANTLFWVSADEQGQGMVFMTEGYGPRKISTNAVDEALQSYRDLSEAWAYTYQEKGTYYYCLNFASANTTWVYDVNLDQWHERAYFNVNTGQYERHRGNVHIYAFGKHLIGDYENGKIYEQKLSYYDDAGTPIRRMRTCPHLADGGEDQLFHERLTLIMKTGVGLNDGEDEDVTPQVMMQFSDDGGSEFGNEHWKSAGKIGKRKWRVYWNRLGRSRDRVYKVVTSARCKILFISADLNAKKGLH